MSVLLCVNKKTWTLHHAAHEKQAGFSQAEKHGHLYLAKTRSWYNEIISVLPDNKPQNRDFFPPLLSVVVVLWRMEMLRLVLLSACVTDVTHDWTTLLSAAPQPNLMMLVVELASWLQLFPLYLPFYERSRYTITFMTVSTFKWNFCQ